MFDAPVRPQSISPDRRPLIVGLGGATRVGSSTEKALAVAMRCAEASGARTLTFGGDWLADLPIYRPEATDRTEGQRELIQALREAQGVIIATPSYHAGPSGLVKNALDMIEDLRSDARPYLDARPVGLIVTAAGAQAGGTTLQALRSTIHALRGWPTPLGVVLNSAAPLFDAGGGLINPEDDARIETVVQQILLFRALVRAQVLASAE